MNDIVTRCPEGLPTPLSSYSHTSSWHDLVFVAGQLPLAEEDGRPLSELGAAEQTDVVLGYVKRALEDAGSSLDRVLKTTIYVASLEDYKEVNEVYSRYFDTHRPARATIEAGALIGGTLVEIEAIAAKNV